MNIIYKYKIDVNLADAAATNDNNAVTGYGIGGGYEGAIAGVSAIGALSPMAITTGVGPIPTVQASYAQVMETSKVYDIEFSNTTTAALTAAHVYKLPLNLLGADVTNQTVNSVEFLNVYNPTTGDIFPLTDRFFYKYDYDQETIFFGFLEAEKAPYNTNLGVKLRLSFISTNI